MKHAIEAFDKVLTYDFNRLLIVGDGLNEHASAFKEHGKTVITVDKNHPADFEYDYRLHPSWLQYDCIWSSHMLEHCVNPGAILKKMHDNLKKGGILAITVPPALDYVVIGHPIRWDAGHLAYNLVLAGFDCRQAMFKKYGYNISVILHKKSIELHNIKMGGKDADQINQYLPEGLKLGDKSDIDCLKW